MSLSLKKSFSPRLALVAAGLSSLIAFTGCNSTVVGSDPLPQDTSLVTRVLANVGQNVMYATYLDLDAKAALLQTAIDTLNTHPTDSNLALAKQAWRNIRSVDEAGEGFLFGPIEELGADDGTDSWPVDVATLQFHLNRLTDSLTKQFMDPLPGNLKGFHAIEYLLWGTNGGTKTADSLTPRQLQYLEATMQSLKGLTDTLAETWNPAGGNFLGAFENAGNGVYYRSQTAAVEDMLHGVVDICDEVSTSKIYEAFSEKNDSLEESRFSDNSNTDFASNLVSVKNVFLGTYVGQGNGLGMKSLILAQKDTALATKIETQTDSAISAIGQMTPTFHLAIFNNRAKVQAAINAIQALRKTLSSQQLKNDLGLP